MRQRQRADGRHSPHAGRFVQRTQRGVQRLLHGILGKRIFGIGNGRQLADRSLQLGQRHLLRRTSRRTPAAGEQPLRHRPEQQQVRRPDQSLAHGRPDGPDQRQGLSRAAETLGAGCGDQQRPRRCLPRHHPGRRAFPQELHRGRHHGRARGRPFGLEHHRRRLPQRKLAGGNRRQHGHLHASVGKPHHV